MDSEKPHTIGSIATRIVFTVIGLLLLYVLSIGPAWYLGVHFHRTNLFLKPYLPLHWATDGTPLRPAFNAYIDWWNNLPGGDPHDM